MIKVELNGRLGNQMFQYSICRLIAHKNGFNFCIPSEGNPSTNKVHIKNVFDNLDLGIEDSNNVNYFYEDDTTQVYNPNIFNTQNNTVLSGFFQTPKYFEGYEELVKSWFNIELNEKSKEILKKYNPEEYCYIHLRGLDYKNDTNWFLSIDYYQKSIDYIQNMYPNISFLIITDDINEAEKLFPNIKSISNDMITDFIILLNSNKLIISNSTFSWWAAWLKTKEIIIAPNNWLNYNKPELGFYPVDIKTNNFTYI
jgi:hypothetical protein